MSLLDQIKGEHLTTDSAFSEKLEVALSVYRATVFRNRVAKVLNIAPGSVAQWTIDVMRHAEVAGLLRVERVADEGKS